MWPRCGSRAVSEAEALVRCIGWKCCAGRLIAAVGWGGAAYRPALGTGIVLAVAGVAASCCVFWRAVTISGGGCSCGSCAPGAWLEPDKAGAGVAGRPTTPALGLLPGPPRLPSACRINRPMPPSFFFVVGIMLSRIGAAPWWDVTPGGPLFTCLRAKAAQRVLEGQQALQLHGEPRPRPDDLGFRGSRDFGLLSAPNAVGLAPSIRRQSGWGRGNSAGTHEVQVCRSGVECRTWKGECSGLAPGWRPANVPSRCVVPMGNGRSLLFAVLCRGAGQPVALIFLSPTRCQVSDRCRVLRKLRSWPQLVRLVCQSRAPILSHRSRRGS